jgi:hypothetical protein
MENTETIGLKFEGNGIKPSSVKASEIADLIKSFEATVLALAKKENPEINEDLVNISFEEIKESSLSLLNKVHVSAVYGATILLAGAFSNNNFDDLSKTTLENLKVFTRFTKRHDCTGFIYKGVEKLASFNKDTDVKYSDKGTISGETTIYGEATRVGGDNPRVSLKINNDYTFSFDVNKEIAIELASNLYKEVGLTGKARWDKRTYRILEFYPKEIILLENEPLSKTFEDLSLYFNNEDLDNFDLIL